MLLILDFFCLWLTSLYVMSSEQKGENLSAKLKPSAGADCILFYLQLLMCFVYSSIKSSLCFS
jgi:hypothetical protein